MRIPPWIEPDCSGSPPESDLSNSGLGRQTQNRRRLTFLGRIFNITNPWQEHTAIQHCGLMKAQTKIVLQVFNWQMNISKY
jgi:hypothetical protein